MTHPIFLFDYDFEKIIYEPTDKVLVKKLYEDIPVKECWTYARYKSNTDTFLVVGAIIQTENKNYEADWGLIVRLNGKEVEVLGGPNGEVRDPKVTDDVISGLINDAIQRSIKLHGDSSFRSLILPPKENDTMSNTTKKILLRGGYAH